MPSSTKIVGTGSSVARAGSDGPWSTPGNVTADDGVYAENSGGDLSNGDYTDFLEGTMSGNLFSIPSDQVIDGVEISFEHKVNSLGDAQHVDVIRLVSSLGDGDNKGDTDNIATETWTLRTFGGPTDLHGLALTPAVVNAASFGFELSIQETSGSGNSKRPQVDYMQITVYYSPNPVNQPLRMVI